MGAWYNEHFLRGCPSKIQDVVRLKIKGKSAKANSCHDKEAPNFYAMPPLPSSSAEKSALMAEMPRNLLSPNMSIRRVSMELVPAGGLIFNCGKAGTNPGNIVSPQLEPTFSGHGSSPRSASTIPPLFLLNLSHGDNGIVGVGQYAPSMVFNQDGHLVNPSTASSGPTDEKLSRRNKYLIPPTSAETKSRLTAGTNPWSLGAPAKIISSDKEEKKRSTAGLEPMPLDVKPVDCEPMKRVARAVDPHVNLNLSPALSEDRNQSFGRRNHSSAFPVEYKTESKLAPRTKPFPRGTSTAIIPSNNKEKKWPTAGLEPLPFGSKPTDFEAQRRLAAAATKVRSFQAGESVFSSLIASKSEEKRPFAADLEPLPFGKGPRVDEFSNFIDETIQIL